MICTYTHKGVNIPLQGLDKCAPTVELYQVSTAKLESSTDTISQVADLHGCQKALWKSRPVDISQWKAVNMHSYLV